MHENNNCINGCLLYFTTLRIEKMLTSLYSSGIVSEERPWSRHAGEEKSPYGTFSVYPQSKSPSWSVELDVEEL